MAKAPKMGKLYSNLRTLGMQKPPAGVRAAVLGSGLAKRSAPKGRKSQKAKKI